MKARLSHVLSRMERFRPARADSTIGDGWSLDEDELRMTLLEHRPAPLLFNKVTATRVMQDLEEHGILERIRRLGYTSPRPEFSGGDPFEARFRLFADHPDAAAPCLLIDVRTHQGEFHATSPFDGSKIEVRALILEWINLQDPAHPLPRHRLALPGQIHPGLGVFRRAYQLTLRYLRETDFDVVLNIPEYFHNAVLYSRDFKFFLAHHEGRLIAMKRDLLGKGLARVSHALSADVGGKGPHVELIEDSRRVCWTSAEQVLPLSHSMKQYFRDVRYRHAAQQEKEACHYKWVEA